MMSFIRRHPVLLLLPLLVLASGACGEFGLDPETAKDINDILHIDTKSPTDVVKTVASGQAVGNEDEKNAADLLDAGSNVTRAFHEGQARAAEQKGDLDGAIGEYKEALNDVGDTGEGKSVDQLTAKQKDQRDKESSLQTNVGRLHNAQADQNATANPDKARTLYLLAANDFGRAAASTTGSKALQYYLQGSAYLDAGASGPACDALKAGRAQPPAGNSASALDGLAIQLGSSCK